MIRTDQYDTVAHAMIGPCARESKAAESETPGWLLRGGANTVGRSSPDLQRSLGRALGLRDSWDKGLGSRITMVWFKKQWAAYVCMFVCVLGTNEGKRGDCEVGEVFEGPGDKLEPMSRKMKSIL